MVSELKSCSFGQAIPWCAGQTRRKQDSFSNSLNALPTQYGFTSKIPQTPLRVKISTLKSSTGMALIILSIINTRWLQRINFENRITCNSQLPVHHQTFFVNFNPRLHQFHLGSRQATTLNTAPSSIAMMPKTWHIQREYKGVRVFCYRKNTSG